MGWNRYSGSMQVCGSLRQCSACSQGPQILVARDAIHKTDTKCLVVAERLHPTKQASFDMGLMEVGGRTRLSLVSCHP